MVVKERELEVFNIEELKGPEETIARGQARFGTVHTVDNSFKQIQSLAFGMLLPESCLPGWLQTMRVYFGGEDRKLIAYMKESGERIQRGIY